jgi:succinyl-CoA synthetase beta subunit
VLDGVASFLHGAKCLLEHRDHIARKRGAMPVLPPSALGTWRERLAECIAFDENTGLQLLRDFGLPANAGHIAASESAATAAAQRLGFPVVLKTAVAGIDHKSDRNGVYLDIKDETQLRTAYQELSHRIGSRVLVAPMIEAKGVEMLLGMIHDEQFGPVVVLGFGGVHVEALADVVYALPPFDVAEAHRLVDRLKLSALLRSPRHKRPLATDEFCRVASQFSAVIAATGDLLSEMDLNPVIVHTEGCVIVDALVVGRKPGPASHSRQAQ